MKKGVWELSCVTGVCYRLAAKIRRVLALHPSTVQHLVIHSSVLLVNDVLESGLHR